MRLNWDVAQYGPNDKFEHDCSLASVCTTGNMVRLDIVNQYVTTSPRVYDWSDVDRRVNTVVGFGMKVCAMVPYWTPEHGKAQVTDNKALLNHLNFVETMINRYGNKIIAVEFGNEPNLKDVQPGGANPVFQAAIAVQVKKVIPHGVWCISPGMAPANTGSGSLRPADYLAQFWPRVAGVFNYCGIHPYGRSADINQPWSTLGQMPGIFAGITGVPFWCTEYNGANPVLTVNAQWVAQTLPWLDTVKDAKTKRLLVDQVFIYAMSDPASDNNRNYQLGCIDGSGNPRPVMNEITGWVAENPS